MTNNKSRGGIAVKIISALLTIAILTGAVFGVGYGLGWFKSSDESAASAGGMVLGSDNGDGKIKLVSSALTASDSTAESTYTLTATVSPSYVTNSGLTWSVAWDATHEGYTEDDWYNDGNSDYSASSLDVTDFVSLSATTGSSVTVSCWQPFGCSVIITCTSDDNADISASCTADYQSKITDFYLSPTAITLYSASAYADSVTNFNLVVKTTAGTIAADYKVSYSVETRMEYIQDEIATNYTKYNNGRPTWLNYDTYLAESQTYGLVFLEALTYGLPCIGRNAYEMPYLINNGETGLILNDDNPQTLADLMLNLIHNEKIKNNVRCNKEKYIKEYSWDSVAQRISKIIENDLLLRDKN